MSRNGMLGKGPLVDGAFGAIVLVVVLAAAVLIPEVSFKTSTNSYTAEFANAAGLATDDDVFVAGVPAGKVTSVTLAGDRVNVGFRLDSGQPLGETTRASVKLGSILGTRLLSVEPSGGGEIERGGSVPLAQTSVPYSLNQLGSRAADTSARLDLDGLRKMIGTLNQSAQDPALIGDALTGISTASGMVGKHNDQFRELLRSTQQLTSSVLDQQDTLVNILGDANLVTETLTQRQDTIRRLITDVHAITVTLNGLLRENKSEIDPVLSDLHTLTDSLARNDSALSESLRLLAPGTRGLANAAGNGPWGDVAAPLGPIPDNLLCVAGLVGGCR